jgi:hypothetical protein
MVEQPYIQKFRSMSSNNRTFIEKQCTFIGSILNMGLMLRMNDEYAIDPENGYNPIEYLEDVRRGVWVGIYDGKTEESNIFRRAMERAYINQYEELVNWDISKRKFDLGVMDFKTLVRLDLLKLYKDLKSKVKSVKDPVVKQHYGESVKKIEKILDMK